MHGQAQLPSNGKEEQCILHPYQHPHIVRWLNAQFRLDRDKSDKSMKFGTQLAYTLLKDIRRGAQVNLLIFSF